MCAACLLQYCISRPCLEDLERLQIALLLSSGEADEGFEGGIAVSECLLFFMVSKHVLCQRTRGTVSVEADRRYISYGLSIAVL